MLDQLLYGVPILLGALLICSAILNIPEASLKTNSVMLIIGMAIVVVSVLQWNCGRTK
jgi:uncharacterized membrane protein